MPRFRKKPVVIEAEQWTRCKRCGELVAVRGKEPPPVCGCGQRVAWVVGLVDPASEVRRLRGILREIAQMRAVNVGVGVVFDGDDALRMADLVAEFAGAGREDRDDERVGERVGERPTVHAEDTMVDEIWG